MKVGFVVALLAATAASGCTGGETTNPNLAAPKLVLQARSDGAIIVFVHSAFGERLYEWISLRADNETVNNRTESFSLEEVVDRSGFYLDAKAATAREVYSLRGRVDVDLATARAAVAFHDDDGDWDAPQNFALPFERVLTRRASE